MKICIVKEMYFIVIPWAFFIVKSGLGRKECFARATCGRLAFLNPVRFLGLELCERFLLL